MNRAGVFGRLCCAIGCHDWRPVVVDISRPWLSRRRCRRCKLLQTGKWW